MENILSFFVNIAFFGGLLYGCVRVVLTSPPNTSYSGPDNFIGIFFIDK